MTLLNYLREIVGYRPKKSILCLLVDSELRPKVQVPSGETTWYGEGPAMKSLQCRSNCNDGAS